MGGGDASGGELEALGMEDKAQTFLKSPYIYFGGKSRAASLIWSRFGDVRNFVEPFFGSGAVLLNRPQPFTGVETVNDVNGFISNFGRAIQHDPERVAYYANSPVNENDLTAKHYWLVNQESSFVPKLEANPDWYDAKIAGYWVYGICAWIGSGWCSGEGPWRAVNGELRKLPHLGDAGRGVNRQLPHLGDAGRGVNRQLPHLGNAGRGVKAYFELLSQRLRHVRVACGDWSRVCGPSVTYKHGLTAVYLDPPYSDTVKRSVGVYANDSLDVAHQVREWAIENGDNPLLRIAVSGYEGEHDFPDTWECIAWKTRGGYDGQNKDRDNQNRQLERIWFSPNCLKPEGVLNVQQAIRTVSKGQLPSRRENEMPLFDFEEAA